MKILLENLFKNSLQKGFIQHQLRRSNAGFTLIELLVVIAVLGVLATIVLLAVNPGEQLKRARDTRRIAAVTQLGRALQAYYTANNGSLALVPDGSAGVDPTDWMLPLITSNDLKVRPSNPAWAAPPPFTHCSAKYRESFPTPPPPTVGQYCYRVDLTTTANNAVVYVKLESNLYNNKCPGGTFAVGVFSTADARSGVVCLAVTPPVPFPIDAVPGNQIFISTP